MQRPTHEHEEGAARHAHRHGPGDECRSPAPARALPASPITAAGLLRVQRSAGNAAAVRAVQRTPVVQRFEGPEHRSLGDSAATTIDLGNGVVLTWGQVVAIAGDEYGTVEELRAASATPEGRGRLLAALQHDRTEDPTSVPWASPQMADAARGAQGSEFIKLASGNAVHFAEGGALAGWQSHHARAISTAVNAGLTHNAAGLQDAHLVEAFGEHFLTDLYSAGHMRTPRAAILSWYTTVFAPRVASAMLGSIKSRVTEAAVTQASAQLPWYVPNSTIRGMIAPIVAEKIDGIVAAKLKDTTFAQALGIGIAGVVSGMIHDKEGKDGLMVSSEDHPEPWRAFGDGQLDASGASRAQAQKAIAAAKAEVDSAYAIGQAGAKEKQSVPNAPPSVVHFGFGSSALAGPNAASITAAAAHMRVHAEAAVDVVGHTDPIGSEADNDALGSRRAEEVQRALVGAGVEASRVKASSAGERQLVTDDPTRFSADRRVALIWRSDPRTPHGTESEADTATRRALEQADAGRAAGYPAVKRFIPSPVPEGAASVNAPLPEWHWGRLDESSRKAIDEWIRLRAGANVKESIAGMDLPDIVKHVSEGPVDQDVTIRPKAIVQGLVDGFLAAPTATLGDLMGESAG